MSYSTLEEISLMGVRLHPMTMEQALVHITSAITEKTPISEVSLNVAKLVHLQRDAALAGDVAGADMVLADGMGIVLGGRMLGLSIPERVAGVDLMDRLLELCARKGWRPYFLGASEPVLREAVDAACARYPNLSVAGAQHGYFAQDDEGAIVARIAASGATCLFVGMPTPKKERFLGRYRGQLNVPFVMGVGGGLDILAGHTARAPALWQATGFEWLYRVIQEPRRMWRRYLTTNLRFAALLVAALLRQYALPATLSLTHREASRNFLKADIPNTGVRCRAIVSADLPQVQMLLQEGFPRRAPAWFTAALSCLAHRTAPSGPQFGFILQAGDAIVGVLLVIASAGRTQPLYNPCCWYVQPRYRAFASALINRARQSAQVTEINISPASHTLPTIRAQGFAQFNSGLFIGIPLLSAACPSGEALCWVDARSAGWSISAAQQTILQDHENFGCFSLLCRNAGDVIAFIFRERRFRHCRIRAAQLIYVDRQEDVSRFAAVIGRRLLGRGILLIAVAADLRPKGIYGMHFRSKAPMYFRGLDIPSACDLRYTEAALFGF